MVSTFLRFLLVSLFWCLLSIVASPTVFASDIAINEIFANPVNEDDEFIELYNTTDTPIDISGWKISDIKKLYVLSDSISAKGFVLLPKSQTKIQLNNTNDNTKEEVFLRNSSDILIDSFSYEVTTNGRSWSRIPDGSGAFVDNTNPSENSPNQLPPPTEVPTATPTGTPTKTPTPTKSPTPIKTPTPTKTVTPTKAPTVKPVSTISTTGKISSVTPTKAAQSQLLVTPSEITGSKSAPTLILGAKTFAKNQDELPTPTPVETKVLGVSKNIFQIMTIGTGIILLSACAILFYLKTQEDKLHDGL